MNQEIKEVRETCPKCKGQDVTIKPAEYDDGTTSDGVNDARCLSCGFEYIVVDI